MVGVSPLKRGMVGDFVKSIYDALLGAYPSFIKLKQAHMKKQINMNHMVNRVNQCTKSA